MIQFPRRLASIDVFRALTMFLMIFVNDLWSLINVPRWLEHADAKSDAMGFSDIIFPIFLFIVGLSLPFAIQNRIKQGDSTGKLLQHILLRSLALLVMGFFHVNLENYSATALVPKPIWQILITIGFFLVWLDYSKEMAKGRRQLLQVSGIALLLVMAIIYKGDGIDKTIWMTPQWWGILGLIGWSYLISSTLFILSKGKLGVLISALIFFILFNSAVQLGWLDSLNFIKEYIWIVGDGSMPTLTVAGIVTSVLYRELAAKEKSNQFWVILACMTVAMLIFGFATRPLWGISKIRATPSWTTICTGISMVTFGFLIYLIDLKEKQNWFNLIKAAGTSTITCYLLPYIHYAFINLTNVHLPEVLRTGTIGIVKSLLYALIIVLITQWLEKNRLRLKL
jgi:predicted acyltransferase